MRWHETFIEYEKAKDEFAKTHKAIECSNCGCEIKPGSDIYTSFGEKVFCCAGCALEDNGITEIIYNDGDEDYESWFPKKDDEQ